MKEPESYFYEEGDTVYPSDITLETEIKRVKLIRVMRKHGKLRRRLEGIREETGQPFFLNRVEVVHPPF